MFLIGHMVENQLIIMDHHMSNDSDIFQSDGLQLLTIFRVKNINFTAAALPIGYRDLVSRRCHIGRGQSCPWVKIPLNVHFTFPVSQ